LLLPPRTDCRPMPCLYRVSAAAEHMDILSQHIHRFGRSYDLVVDLRPAFIKQSILDRALQGHIRRPRACALLRCPMFWSGLSQLWELMTSLGRGEGKGEGGFSSNWIFSDRVVQLVERIGKE
jgi:hypothetical protein